MIHPELLGNTFPEEIYSVPPRPMVAIHCPWHELTDPEKTLLEKILGSVKLSLNEVKVISTHQLDILKWSDKPSHVLAFGLGVPGLKNYEPIEVQGTSIIMAPALSRLDQDKEGKQKLWGALKQMLG